MTDDKRSLRQILDEQTPEEREAAIAEFNDRMAEGRQAHDAGRVTARVTMVVPGYLPDGSARAAGLPRLQSDAPSPLSAGEEMRYYAKFDYSKPSKPVALFRVEGITGQFLDKSNGDWVDAPRVVTDVQWDMDIVDVTEAEAMRIKKEWGFGGDDSAHRHGVIAAALSARTVAECDDAERLLTDYFNATGDDTVLEYGAGISRMRDAVRLVEGGLGDEDDPIKRRLGPRPRRNR